MFKFRSQGKIGKKSFHYPINDSKHATFYSNYVNILYLVAAIALIAWLRRNHLNSFTSTHAREISLLVSTNQSYYATCPIDSLDKQVLVAFLVRTYYGHFDTSNPFNIVSMLRSLQSQHETNWIAYIMNSDITPLPLTHHPVLQMMIEDSRIRLIDIPVKRKYDKWVAGYDVTDQAIERLYSLSISYLVVTNGDNFYTPDFLSSMSLSAGDYDLYYTDYYSRYERPNSTLIPSIMSASKCHLGKVDRGYIDLGGVALSLPKLHACNLRFMDYGAVNSQDGLLFMSLSSSGWTSKRIVKCAFHHAPNPYGCHLLNGIWFNSSSSTSELSDACMSKITAQRYLDHYSNISRLVTSSSGIQMISLIEPYNSINRMKFEESSTIFSIEFNNIMTKQRRTLCKNLVKSGFKFDATAYKLINPDLRNLTDKNALKHFAKVGCTEIRKLPEYPKDYIRTCRK
jgi:hypothetical protein